MHVAFKKKIKCSKSCGTQNIKDHIYFFPDVSYINQPDFYYETISC